MNSSGTIALSIFKPSDGTTYQLDGSRIAPDSEGYKEVTNTAPTTLGTLRYVNTKHTFEIRHNDSSFHSTFLADADAKNHVWNLVVAEMDGFVLWYEDSDVNIISQEAYVDPSNGGFPYVIRMSSYGTAIARGTNLLYAYAKTQGFASAWQDSDSNGVADKFTNNASSPSFSAGVQTITTSATLYEFLLDDIVFPLYGLNLTASLYANAIAATQDTLTMIERNFSGSIINTSSNAKNALLRTSKNFTTQSNIFDFRFILCQSNGTNEVSSFSDPAIRLNGSTEYVDG